jgi:hypothetical protein
MSGSRRRAEAFNATGFALPCDHGGVAATLAFREAR